MDADQNILETVTCTATPSRRTLTVRASEFTQLSSAPWARVDLIGMRQSSTSVSTRYDAEVLAVTTLSGVVAFE